MTLKTHKAAMRANFEREIISIASEELAQHDRDSFSLRGLADKMGCAVGTLYLYFDDKQALLHAVIEHSFLELLEAVEAVPASSDPLELLRARFRAYVEFGLRKPNHYRCAFELPGVAKAGKYRPHPAFDILRENVRACIEAGLFRSHDVEAVSKIVWVSVHGLTSLLIARPKFPWGPRDQLVEGLTETVIAGLLAPRGQPNGRCETKARPVPSPSRHATHP